MPKKVNVPVKWWSSPRTLLRHILMLDDTTHSVALGTAIGMFIGMTPTVGIQMMLVITFSVLTRWLFNFNRVAALITVYISNPLTLAPIYYFNYKVGTIFVEGHLTKEDFVRILEYDGFRQWWQTIVHLFVEVGAPLIVGSLIVATACGLLTYPAMRRLLRVVHSRDTESAERTPEPAASADEVTGRPTDSDTRSAAHQSGRHVPLLKPTSAD